MKQKRKTKAQNETVTGEDEQQETPKEEQSREQDEDNSNNEYVEDSQSSVQSRTKQQQQQPQNNRIKQKKQSKKGKSKKQSEEEEEVQEAEDYDGEASNSQQEPENVKDQEEEDQASQSREKKTDDNKNTEIDKQKKMQSFVRLRSQVFKASASQATFDPMKNHDSSNEPEVNDEDGIKVFFGDQESIEKNPHKKLQNKVRTQRYTIFTWAPLSLLYQFKRAPNIYFLIISILTFLPFSPKNPASMVGTFVLVLVFTMLKEAYEDYQRYKQDKEVNNKLAKVLNPLTMQWETRKWEEIEPGLIIKFEQDTESPADIAILYSKNQSGVVYVDTMNLDGETNLKEKNALFEQFDERALDKMNGEARCETSTPNLEKWDAQIFYRMKYFKPSVANIKNLLLRGCFVRNTTYGIGIVIYTGMETKIMKNLKKPPHKVSNIMKLMNKMLYTVFAFQIVLIAVFAGLNINWIQDNADIHTYLNIDGSANKAGLFFIQLLVFWVAYSHMIPISLYVIIEILKLGQASFINKDLQMYDEETESFAKCRNSDLIEELGQVEMVFSDKTGTLTQNKMVFKKCQINGIKYGQPKDDEEDEPDGMAHSGVKEILHQIKAESKYSADMFRYATAFCTHLALCNTVLCDVTDKEGKINYKASSPDEYALVKGSKQCGIQLVQRKHNRVYIFDMIAKTKKEYTVLAEFPFDSVRKRMSVVIKDSEGKYKILTKGADSVMLERIQYEKNEIDGLRDIIEEDLYNYSCEGLRTLMMGERSISDEEYKQFERIFDKLQQSNSHDKEAKLFALFDQMEQKLKYLGCTAIEDKLQNGVPATIAKLMQADIRFFMLTGDKLETAIEIAKSCNVIQEDMEVFIFANTNREKLFKSLQKLLDKHEVDAFAKVNSLKDVELENQVLTIEGSTLAVIIEDQELTQMFFHLAVRSRSVVCCRMSPKQKADVVSIFKTRGKWITLAIGDGANDVSMIMEAHIGVGIKGKEGTQAVRSADFAISQFQYLMRLLLFQGRTGYIRVSSMICYYFYKNIVLVFTEFYFAFFNGFSGQIYFLDWLPVLYNAVFTSWHCLFALLLEKDVNDNYSFRYPQIYKAGQLGKYFNFAIFWKWIILALWHGAVAYYTPILMGVTPQTSTGIRGEHWLHSTISFTSIIHLVFYKLLLETRHLSWIAFFSGILSMLLYYGVLLLAQIPDISYIFQPQILGLVEQMALYPTFWLIIIAAPFACLVPDIFARLVMKVFFPNPVDKVLKEYKLDPEYDFYVDLKKLEEQLAQRKQQNMLESEEDRKSIIMKKKTSFYNGNQNSYERKEESSVNLNNLQEQIEKDRHTDRKQYNKNTQREVNSHRSSSTESIHDLRTNRKSARIDSDNRDSSPSGNRDNNNDSRSSVNEEEQANRSKSRNSQDEEEEEEEQNDSQYDAQAKKQQKYTVNKNNQKQEKKAKQKKQQRPQSDEEEEEQYNSQEDARPESSGREQNDEEQEESNRDESSRSVLEESIRSDRKLVELKQDRKKKQNTKSQKKQEKQKKGQKSKGPKEFLSNGDGSMFSVSEVNTTRKESGNKQYLEYFEGLQKEVKKEKINTQKQKPESKKAQQQKLESSVSSVAEGDEVLSNNNKSDNDQQKNRLQIYDRKTTKYDDKAQSDIEGGQNHLQPLFKSSNSRRDIKSSQGGERGQEEKLEIKQNINEKLLSNVSQVSSSINDLKSIPSLKQNMEDINKQDTKQKYAKSQHQVQIDKDAFRKICANRTNAFMIQTNLEIPKAVTTNATPAAPSQIVDNATIAKNVQGNNKKAAEKIEKDGHPLESSRLLDEWPQSARKQSAQKQKKYVGKYKDKQDEI